MGNTRKELKNAVMFFALFQVVNFISIQTGREIRALHFLLGIIAGLAFSELMIGLLSDSVYHRIRSFKKNIKLWISLKQNV
ncbi:hypothetical protein ACHAL6_11895 [Proteiniclasticum sp. C24MP]|uniref:hypothetical protein n=1 Tax=Proteiniclasticum sp. C24MP TaxID=3374101 RepID=UPI0037547D86